MKSVRVPMLGTYLLLRCFWLDVLLRCVWCVLCLVLWITRCYSSVWVARYSLSMGEIILLLMFRRTLRIMMWLLL